MVSIILKVLAALLISFLSIIIFVMLLFSKSYVSPLKGKDSISIFEKVKINNAELWVLTRTENKNKPLLLIVAGFPGGGESLAYHRLKKLESEFIVVNFEQRGAGKSYSKSLTDDDLSLEILADDINDLTLYLKNVHSKAKIFLAAHSFGSLLAFKAIDKEPQHYFSLTLIAPVVDPIQNDVVLYNHLLELTKSNGDDETFELLKKIGTPPHRTLSDFSSLRNSAGKYKMIIYNDDARGKLFNLQSLRLYTIADFLKLRDSVPFYFRNLVEDVSVFDTYKELPGFEIPLHFIVGRHDMNTPYFLAQHYYDFVDSPGKSYTEFQESAHFPHYEEPDRFFTEMLRIRDDAQ
jgi:pimeloyl-ACP methyl ester carboxylesterase